MRQAENRRVLLIDDTDAIHDDFRKILAGQGSRPDLERLESALFGLAPQRSGPEFELECARQGEEGLLLLRRGLAAGRPFALAFVDMRMPPGWDGVETIERLWREDPRLQVVICTACSDHSWEEVLQRLEVGDRLLILKKPFDAVELRQLACALSTKWGASRQAELKVAQLEKLVRARDCQLENLNLDLLRARDAARAGSRVKREFLANVGHEIRTPMTTIMAMTQLALQGELGASQRQQLETAQGAAESLMATITGILDLSVLESGRLELELTDFRLEEVLGRLARVMEEKAELKQIRLGIDAEPEALAPLVGDPYRLGQVLMNLCDNAVKFSEQGEVRVRVQVERREEQRLALRFSVRDSGTGIGAEQLAHLFQPFSQLDASSTRRKGGAGMGLAIARELVELMGGELAVASQPGRGSEFSFCVPFPRAETAAPSPPEPCRQQPAAPLPAPAAREVDPETVRELLDRMSALFDRDLSRALALKELLQRELEGSVLAPEFGRLARQVEQFDFDGALASRKRLELILENLRERELQAPPPR